MDLSTFGIAGVAVITVICYLIGQTVKASGLANKWIPIIVGVAGGALGVVGKLVIADFPANDYLTAVAVGIVSGLAATGVDQINKQMKDCREKGADNEKEVFICRFLDMRYDFVRGRREAQVQRCFVACRGTGRGLATPDDPS